VRKILVYSSVTRWGNCDRSRRKLSCTARLPKICPIQEEDIFICHKIAQILQNQGGSFHLHKYFLYIHLSQDGTNITDQGGSFQILPTVAQIFPIQEEDIFSCCRLTRTTTINPGGRCLYWLPHHPED
jgi:hypothetical protein